MTKTSLALNAVAAGLPVSDAARLYQLSTSAIYQALRKVETRTTCPCCGGVVKILKPMEQPHD